MTSKEILKTKFTDMLVDGAYEYVDQQVESGHIADDEPIKDAIALAFINGATTYAETLARMTFRETTKDENIS